MIIFGTIFHIKLKLRLLITLVDSQSIENPVLLIKEIKMNRIALILIVAVGMSSCVGKKKFVAVESDLETSRADVVRLNSDLARIKDMNDDCNAEKNRLNTELNNLKSQSQSQISDLKDQIADLKSQRDKQLDQIGDLAVLSQSASDNIKETLTQLKEKDEYIQALNAAKSKADSMNLALAVNLTSVLKDNINDEDIDVQVDKTVVYINLSDKMLYKSGSANITPRANEVLGKIAKIVKSRPDVEVMVEGHTDNVPISTAGIKDNWDLSVKRATSVVRVLNETYGVPAGKLIAAGRGEYAPLTSNDTADGRSTNRRTRIIILPKLDQFYELLDPANVPE